MELEPSAVTQPIAGVGHQVAPALPSPPFPPSPAFDPSSPFPPLPQVTHARPAAPVQPRKHLRIPRFWVAALALAVAVTLALAGYLLVTTNAWQRRATELDRSSRDLGSQLGAARADLAASKIQLDAVRTQLTTAQDRITQLAAEKARLGDDRAAQKSLADYQARATAAAAQVASALDKCIAGQQKYIGYLKDASSYDPNELAQFGSDVAGYCQSATDANSSLQQELRK